MFENDAKGRLRLPRIFGKRVCHPQRSEEPALSKVEGTHTREYRHKLALEFPPQEPTASSKALNPIRKRTCVPKGRWKITRRFSARPVGMTENKPGASAPGKPSQIIHPVGMAESLPRPPVTSALDAHPQSIRHYPSWSKLIGSRNSLFNNILRVAPLDPKILAASRIISRLFSASCTPKRGRRPSTNW